MTKILKTSLAIFLFCGIARADQLPAPPTFEQGLCTRALEVVRRVLGSGMDFHYSQGVRDRDQLEKKMVEFSQDAIRQGNALCPVGTLTPKAIDDMAYRIIADKFGR